MAIDPMVKTKVMRPSLIDTIDKINEIIEVVNSSDMQAVDQRLTALETSDVTINGRIDGAISRIDTAEGGIDALETDVSTIKATLYTPLSKGGE